MGDVLDKMATTLADLGLDGEADFGADGDDPFGHAHEEKAPAKVSLPQASSITTLVFG